MWVCGIIMSGGSDDGCGPLAKMGLVGEIRNLDLQLFLISYLLTRKSEGNATMAGKLRRATVCGMLLTRQYGTNALYIPRSIGLPFSSLTSGQIRGGLFASESDGKKSIEYDDFEDFMNDMAEAPASLETTNNNETESPTNSSHFIQRQQAVGIGGNSGFVYDVNALKKNLVQESVRGCKQELLSLLGDGREYSGSSDVKSQRAITAPKTRKDRDELIEERLAALVQVGPTLCFSL